MTDLEPWLIFIGWLIFVLWVASRADKDTKQ